MKKFINKVEDVVPEMLEGLCAANETDLALVPDAMAVFAKRHDPAKVALVSGGGSGHEPAHAGFVGTGMLAGAVAGHVFTAPTPDQIAACAKALKPRNGVLFVVKNYTGDILNFQLAEELLGAEGVPADHVVVDDDVALENSTYTTGRRGIAGTVFVHKIAGALAERGASLPEVKEVAQKVVANLASYGVSLDACTVPARGQKGFTLAEDEAEIGLGIHGEPGVARAKMKTADEFADYLYGKIKEFLKLKAGEKVAVLVNGLGATPLMELHILARRVLADLKRDKIAHHPRVLVGNYMTSLDMPGASVSLLRLDEQTEALYDAPADTPALRVMGR